MNREDWLFPMLRVWRDQKRRVWTGVPTMTGMHILARIREEGAGASHSTGRVFQLHPEVYTGEGLEIERAVRHMTNEMANWVLHVHWIPFPLPGDRIMPVVRKCKVYCDGMPVRTYWDHLERAYDYLDGWVGNERAGRPRAAAQKRANT